ncbi:parallel beta-helix repeat (two copies) [Maribacter dokdonensis]|uniref:Parallel beta-helix repeat (Two copies) n=1 Tax=Maribacter dokdonensis TaxID=320912 RepID=A0ABY0UTI4_9FLAO|nr:hypothetical protein [Maribacter dokdonensis]SDT16057.1 parallel beta-helix repeat (two copies) [Maribacter dokdonensis]
MRYLIIFFICFSVNAQNTYYVTLSGSNSNNGFSESNAFRTLTYAANKMSDSDIVYVKAGNYGNDRPTISNNNVSWIGYSNTPGDLDRSSGQGASWQYKTESFSNTRYPTVTASNHLSDICYNVSGNNVTLKNLQVTNGHYGFNISGNNVVADNLSVFDMGDTNGGEGGGSSGTNQYSFGIRFRGNNSTLRNSIVVNSSGEGITFGGTSSNHISGNTIESCEVYSDKTTAQNGTDYFILLAYADDNIVSNCHVEQINDTNSGRHGLSVKAAGSGNIFENSTTAGVNLEANFVAVHNNTWRNISINGKYLSDGAGTGGKIRVANGAHHNLFENISLKDCRYGIAFADWDDGVAAPGNAPSEYGGGNDNDFVNILLVDVLSAIHFEFFQALSTADDNRIFNLTVHNSDRLIEADMANSGTEFYNLVIDDVTNLISGSDTTLNPNTIFSYVNVHNSFSTSAFTPYNENNITSIAFSFTNEGNNDYSISSNVLDVGQNLSGVFDRAAFDYNGNARTAPYTLGAYEYGGAPPAGDEDPPVVISNTLLSVTETTFRVDWSLDEGSKGRIRYGTSTGSYPNETNTENNFLTRHIQTVGGNNADLLNAGTTYYYQFYVEDASGNNGYSPEYTQTTLGTQEPETPNPVTIVDKRGLFLKSKKM